MSVPKLPQELEEQAAAYTLGALDTEDRALFEKRLALNKEGLSAVTEQFQAVVTQLGISVKPASPRPSLRERMLTHIAAEAERETKSFNAVASQLSFNAEPMTPPASLRERLLQNLGPQKRHPSVSPPLTFVKSGEGQWQEIAPGVLAKVLYFDPVSRRATALVRMAPGSGYAPHRHAEAEELYVLEGGCFCGGQELVAGDYHRAEAGTEHHDTSSDDGCLLLVISSPQNEMLG